MNISLLMWLLPTLVALLLLIVVGRNDWLWQHRRHVAEVAAALLLAGLPFVSGAGFPLPLVITVVFVQLWSALLPARLLFGRLPVEFLRTSTVVNAVVALGVFVVLFDSWLVWQAMYVSVDQASLYAIGLLVVLVAGLGFLYQILWTFKHYRLRKLDQNLKMRDLPTITLAIPARNETHALEACLRAALASEYPKLEIIVLDDCSQDLTPEIIRSFAHDGVRFVQGEVPAEGWLGKTQAQRTMADHASGDFIVFADVDTHLSPQSLHKLMAYALSNHADMVSVLPQRRDGWSRATLLTQLRSYWQIALPLTRRRVPVASQCWLIRRSALTSLGGFDAVRQKIVPEGYFARALFADDAYRFIISNEEVGVTTAKRWSSQAETSLRILYPTLRRQPYILLLACVAMVVLLLPFGVLVWWPGDTQLLVLAMATSGLLWVGYGLVVARTHPLTWPFTVLLLPLSLAQELCLLVASMLAYEFGDVNWKGRNVCYPVVRQK